MDPLFDVLLQLTEGTSARERGEERPREAPRVVRRRELTVPEALRRVVLNHLRRSTDVGDHATRRRIVLLDEDARRRDVAVRDTVQMESLQVLGETNGPANRLVGSEGASPMNPLRERFQTRGPSNGGV